MARRTLAGLDRRGLRLWLGAFFLALALPAAVLVRHSYGQLRWEAFHQYRVQAEELTSRIDARLGELVEVEESRAFTDYAFLIVRGDTGVSFVGRSALSTYPVSSAFPGLIGYFQIDPDGGFSTPLLPAAHQRAREYGVVDPERDARLAVEQRIRGVLADNQLVTLRQRATPPSEATPEPARSLAAESKASTGAESDALEREDEAPRASGKVASQAAFDQLASTQRQVSEQRATPRQALRVEDLNLADRYEPDEDAPARNVQPPAQSRVARKERSAAPAPRATATLEEQIGSASVPITTFESELDPFEFRRLDSGHFVLFRRVWRAGAPYVQGLLIDSQPFLEAAFGSAFRETAVSRMSDMVAAYGGEVVSAYTGQEARRYLPSSADQGGDLLYRSRIATPLEALELVFSITHLPPGPGARVIVWTAAILALVLCGGFYLMYRLALGQIELTRQQQDFVSAVSHELRTPLTSIRMYGEMLREGWASEEKKRTYYDYIFHESERLSRLIGNVLQLARMTRNDVSPELVATTAGELVDAIRPKITAQVEGAGFALQMTCDAATAATALRVDPDFVSQILINLVDNAIKFSSKADRKAVDVGFRARSDGRVVLTVRDYGSGVERDQMRKIFVLFYRSENELTRETVGTGIGLSLVHQLATSMGGKVDVINREPGAEFAVAFPAATAR